MSYELLTDLYFSVAANAALTSPEARRLLHVKTPVEALVTTAVRRGLDVVLTGNPGDGKSHLVRMLVEEGALSGAEIEDDLSAHPTRDVLLRWEEATRRGRPFVLCANEGPLKDLLEAVDEGHSLGPRVSELRGQLGRLLVRRVELLPPEPRFSLLIDLADRNVLDQDLVDSALLRLANERFLPVVGDYDSADTSAGRNLLLLRQQPECRRRLCGAIVAAGRRCGEHVTFRQLWAGISFALARAKSIKSLESELRSDADALGTLPIDNLVHAEGRGALAVAARSFADPASVSDPDLDEQLWATGQLASGQWLLVDPPHPPDSPATKWRNGDQLGALKLHAELKRAVALAHERGESLISRLGEWRPLPATASDAALCAEIVDGIRALYLSPDEARGAPGWLDEGLPLWVGLTYEEVPVESRPHVAVTCVGAHEFEVLRPVRPLWLGSALGDPPDEAWLSHRASGIALRVDPGLMHILSQARRSSGPIPTPEPVNRFLARLAGWDEKAESVEGGVEPFSVLSHPRGAIVAQGRVLQMQGGRSKYGLG